MYIGFLIRKFEHNKADRRDRPKPLCVLSLNIPLERRYLLRVSSPLAQKIAAQMRCNSKLLFSQKPVANLLKLWYIYSILNRIGVAYMGRENKKEAVAALHREQIMKAAEKLFSEKGFSQTTIDDISKASEYSRRTIYAYYESKDDILYHIVEKGLIELKKDIESAINLNEDFITEYKAICMAISKYQYEYSHSADNVNRANTANFDFENLSDTVKHILLLGTEINTILAAFIEDGKEKAAFEAAYAAAQKVLENPTDQAAVDKAEKDLEDARKALLATSPKPEEDKEAPTKPSDLKETETTTTTVKVEWKASTDNVGVTGYNVYADGKLAETVKGDVLTAELKDLKAGTEYTIEVEAFDAAGNKSEKASVKATTKEEQKPDPNPEEDKEAPTKPSDLKVTDKTDTTVKIEWKASKDNVGVTGYKIFVNGKSIGTVKDDVLTAEIAKLTPKTEYTIEVVAYDAAGNKSAAASVKATTKEGKTPETPTTPEVKPGTVQTGDATPFAVPFMMMFIAVAMFAGVSVIRVKKRK